MGFLISLAGMAAGAGWTRAQEQPNPPADIQPQPAAQPPAEPNSMGGELLLFENVPVVITASRTARPLTNAGMPISVISADDIHYGGLINIPDMLRFVPGMDVLTIDRNRTALGVHGLHFEFSDRTLVLIDGRNATNPVFGGVEFIRLPIFPEDIERIEVARGPGGAAWGANALNGVINIIPKRPSQTHGVLTSFTLNEDGDTFTHLRAGDGAGDLDYRVSLGYSEQESSEDAIANDTFMSRDFSRNAMIDSEAEYRVSDVARFRFGLAHSNVEHGPFELAFTLPARDVLMETTRAFAQYERDLEDGRLYARWFGNFERTDSPQFWGYDAAENDLEIQVEQRVSSDHTLTFGGNVRSNYVNFEEKPPGHLMRSGEESAWWAGAFIIDRWTVSDTLTVESQFRADYYSETHPDWSARVSALIALDREKNHILRFSGAKAFRAPLAGARGLNGEAGPVPGMPGVFLLNWLPADDLDNEQVYAAEIGYSARLDEHALLRVDGYYHRYEDLISYSGVPDPMGFGRRFFTFANIDGGTGHGLEAELRLGDRSASIAPWYAYNDIEPDEPTQSIRGWFPANHKVGVIGRLSPVEDVTFSANYRFTDVTPSNQDRSPTNFDNVAAPGTHRLDLTAAFDLFDKRAELLIGVTDVFDSDTHPVLQAGSFTGTEGAGRTLFARFQMKF